MEQELVEPVANRKSRTQPQKPNYLYRIRWFVLALASFAMLAYGHLLPTLYADLFTNLGAYRQFLGRFSFLSMLFLQVVYVFDAIPEDLVAKVTENAARFAKYSSVKAQGHPFEQVWMRPLIALLSSEQSFCIL